MRACGSTGVRVCVHGLIRRQLTLHCWHLYRWHLRQRYRQYLTDQRSLNPSRPRPRGSRQASPLEWHWVPGNIVSRYGRNKRLTNDALQREELPCSPQPGRLYCPPRHQGNSSTCVRHVTRVTPPGVLHVTKVTLPPVSSTLPG